MTIVHQTHGMLMQFTYTRMCSSPLFGVYRLTLHPVGLDSSCSALLKAGADCLHRNIYGQTALHLAAQRGHVTTVLVVLAAGVPVSSKDDKVGRPSVSSGGQGRLCKLATINVVVRDGEQNPKRRVTSTLLVRTVPDNI